MSAYERARKLAGRQKISVIEAAYKLLGMGNIHIYELEEIEALEASKAPSGAEE